MVGDLQDANNFLKGVLNYMTRLLGGGKGEILDGRCCEPVVSSIM